MAKAKGVSYNEAVAQFGAERVRAAAGRDPKSGRGSNWKKRGVPQAVMAALYAEDLNRPTPSAVTDTPEHLKDELQRRRAFTMIVTAMAGLQHDALHGPTKAARDDAARRLDLCWDVFRGGRRLVAQLAGWTDQDWKRIITEDPTDHWKRLTKHREDMIEAWVEDWAARHGVTR